MYIVDRPGLQNALPYMAFCSYMLLSGGFCVTHALWLRAVLGLGYTGLTCYHILQYRPLREPLIGSIMFACINAKKAADIYFADAHVDLTDEEEEIYAESFEGKLTRGEFLKLLAMAHWVNVEEETRVVTQGDIPNMYLVVQGSAYVQMADSGVQTATIARGGLIGEMAFASQCPACANVIVSEGSRLLVWDDTKNLRHLLDTDVGIKRGLQFMFLDELSKKLRQANLALEGIS